MSQMRRQFDGRTRHIVGRSLAKLGVAQRNSKIEAAGLMGEMDLW